MHQKIRGFDGLRGLAVIAVVLTHLHAYKWLVETAGWSESIIRPISGTIEVHVFFVLSGFLITMLLIREQREHGAISIRAFFVRRSLRILPLYGLVLLLTAAMHGAGDALSGWESLAYAMTYTYNFIPRMHYSGLLGHTWSLAVEEHFYLVWPFVFSALFVVRRRLLLAMCLVFFVAALVAGLLLSSVDLLRSHFFIERWTFVAGGSIALGAALALLLESGDRMQTWRSAAENRATLAIGTAFFVHPAVLEDSGLASTHLMVLGAAAIIAWIYLNQDSLLVKFLEFQPLRYIGVISYGVYMWQGFFLSTGPNRFDGQTWPVDQATGFILLMLVAPLSYHGFEKPLLVLRHHGRSSAFGTGKSRRPLAI